MARIGAPLALLAMLCLAAAALTQGGAGEGGLAVSLVKMPYRGERNLPDVSEGPDTLEKGGLRVLLETQGCRLKPVSTVVLSPEEQRAYGEWNRLGLANGQLARIVAADRKEGTFPVGLLANCSSLLGMLGGLQHSGTTSRPLRVGMVFIDAHGDFNTPETTLSGMLGGMPVAVAAGHCLTRLRLKSGLDPALPERHIVLAAVRDTDPKHVDMDVLDPNEVPGHPLAVAGGPTSLELADALTRMFTYEKAAAFGVASTPFGDRDRDGLSRQAAYNLIRAAVKGVQQRGNTRP